jgi:glycosyltransferase involved in cell wall biosynthesis
MVIVHLLASPFFGGPERQVLGLARAHPPAYRTVFLSFAERGLSVPFLEKARQHGFEAVGLRHNAPFLRRAANEIASHLRRVGARLLCCSGYKPDVIGWLAARLAGVPVIAIAHGWTAVTLKVRLNEMLDRLVLHGMDRVVCVSEGQAAKVRRAGVAPARVVVIRNAVGRESFQEPDPRFRQELLGKFAQPPRWLVGAAGRLSPEKGFDQLVEAARVVQKHHPAAGFVVFGDGLLREALTRRVAACGLGERFVFAGFRGDLEKCLPNLDVFVQPSFTEGLPVAVLEASAAGLPVVATAVGGTPEVVADGSTGFLVPAGRPDALAEKLDVLLRDAALRQRLGGQGRRRVEEAFTFEAQSDRYQRLFAEMGIARLAASLGERVPSPHALAQARG